MRLRAWSAVSVASARELRLSNRFRFARCSSATSLDIIVDDRTVEVSFDLTVPTGRDAACAVQALNEQSAVVGWLVVEYPASSDRFRSYTETVRTTELATTGLISSCWLP